MPFLTALDKLLTFVVLPASALVDARTLPRVAQISQDGDLNVALVAARVLLFVLGAAECGGYRSGVVAALRAVLRAFGPEGVHRDAAA